MNNGTERDALATALWAAADWMEALIAPIALAAWALFALCA